MHVVRLVIRYNDVSSVTVIGVTFLLMTYLPMTLSGGERSRSKESFDGCKWAAADGGVIDLSSVGNKDGTARFPDEQAPDGFLYSYNPCYPFNEGTCSNAAVCQMTWNKDEYYQAGDAVRTELQDDQGRPVIHYQADTEIHRDSYVTLLCDPTASSPVLTALGDLGYAEYHFELTTKCACGDGCGGSGTHITGSVELSISIGSLLCVVMLSVVVAYVVGGVVYNRARYHSTGSQLLPHLSFWSSLPGLVKDGCVFTFNKLRQGKRSQYEAM